MHCVPDRQQVGLSGNSVGLAMIDSGYGNGIGYDDGRSGSTLGSGNISGYSNGSSNNISSYGNSSMYGDGSSSSVFGFGNRIGLWRVSTALALAMVALATCWAWLWQQHRRYSFCSAFM